MKAIHYRTKLDSGQSKPKGIEFYSMARKYSVEGYAFTKKPHTAMDGHIRPMMLPPC
jgi:hypothetical protein